MAKPVTGLIPVENALREVMFKSPAGKKVKRPSAEADSRFVHHSRKERSGRRYFIGAEIAGGEVCIFAGPAR